MIADPGKLTSQGFLDPGTVYFLTPRTRAGAGAAEDDHQLRRRAPTSPASARSLQNVGDVNGDGKPDLLLGYQKPFGGPDFAWMLYGR